MASGDKLNVQVAIRIKSRPGQKIKKKVLQEILQRLVDHEPLPRNVEIRGIFWRNPNRNGKLARWRYHYGADLSARPDGPIEGRPRESLRDAVDSLAPVLESGNVTFR